MHATHTNRWALPIAIALAMVIAFACGMPAHARDYDTAVTISAGEQFTLAETETIGGALVVTGGDATVLGRVKRDVIVVDGSATLGPTARVDGSVLTVRGTVERDELALVRGESRSLTAAEFAEVMSEVPVADMQEPAADQPAPGDEAPAAADGQAPSKEEAADETAAEPGEGAAEPEQEAAPTDEGTAVAETATDPEQDRAGFGETIIVEADEVVAGDVASFGGPIVVKGTVRGDVASFAGPVTVSGTVDGDIATFGGAVDLETGSRVEGDIATFGAAVNKDPGAIHVGRVQGFGEGLSRWMPGGQAPRAGTGAGSDWVGGTIFALLIALLVAAIFPNATRTVADATAEQPGRAAGHGALTLLLFAPACVLLILTCVGIVLVPVLILGSLAAGVLGATGIYLLLGRQISRRLGWSVSSPLGLVSMGVVAVQLIALTQFVPALQIVHALVSLAVLLFGLGGALMTGFGTIADGTWITGRLGGSAEAAPPPAAPEQPAPPTAEPVQPPRPTEPTGAEDPPESPPASDPEADDGSDASEWAPSSAEEDAEAEDDRDTPPAF